VLPRNPVSSYLTFSPLLRHLTRLAKSETLSPNGEGIRKSVYRSGFSLLRYSALTNSFPLGNMVLCVARTFLHSAREKRQTDLLFNCKDNYNISKIFISFILQLISYLHLIKDLIKDLIKEKFLYYSTFVYFCC